MNGQRRQRGASLFQILIILGLVGFMALLAIRIVPVYFDAWTVRNVVNTMAEERALRGASRHEILQSLQRRFDINNVTHIRREDIVLRPVSGGMELVVEYEARTHLMGNFDGVAHFRFQVVIPN